MEQSEKIAAAKNSAITFIKGNPKMIGIAIMICLIIAVIVIIFAVPKYRAQVMEKFKLSSKKTTKETAKAAPTPTEPTEDETNDLEVIHNSQDLAKSINDTRPPEIGSSNEG